MQVAGLPALMQALDREYRVFRTDPSYTNFDRLQQAMTAYQTALNTFHDTLAVGA